MKGILIVQKLLLRGKIKKVLSRALTGARRRARNAYDQNEQTLLSGFF